MVDYPAVSVVTITYGHEDYISQTLDGVLMQNYNGKIEFIIANDNSPDATDEVVKNYFSSNNLPANFSIKYTKHEINKDMIPNFIWALEQASGKYIALCEGDDYWTDPLKLQKQVDVLENNPNVNICSHPSKRRYGDFIKEDNYGYWGEEPKIITTQQVIANYASTAPAQSILFRNENVQVLSSIISQLLGGHSTIQIFYSLKGGLYYLPEYMSVYRVESSSSVSKILFKNDEKYLERQIKNWKGLDLLNKYSNYRFHNEFQKSKRERAFSTFYTGYLTNRQKLELIKKYNLYSEPIRLGKILKSEIHSQLGLSKTRILNFIRNKASRRLEK